MIKKILRWALRPIIAPLIGDALHAALEGPFRDYVNEQLEGAVGQCQEHAVETVQDALKERLRPLEEHAAKVTVGKFAEDRDMEDRIRALEGYRTKFENMEGKPYGTPHGSAMKFLDPANPTEDHA